MERLHANLKPKECGSYPPTLGGWGKRGWGGSGIWPPHHPQPRQSDLPFWVALLPPCLAPVNLAAAFEAPAAVGFSREPRGGWSLMLKTLLELFRIDSHSSAGS